MRPLSLRARLLLLLVGSATVVVLLGGAVTERVVTGRMADSFDRALLEQARALVTLTKQWDEGLELDFAGEFMPQFQEGPDPSYFQLQTADGTLVELSESFLSDGVAAGATLRWLASPAPHARFADVMLPDGRPGRQVQVDFLPQLADDEDHEALGGRPTSAGFGREAEGSFEVAGPLPPGRAVASVMVARERGSHEARVLALRLVLAGTALALLAAVASLSILALALGLRPVHRLAREVRDLDAGRLDTRFAAGDLPRELRPIAEQLDGLLDRIRAAIDRERQLTSDLAHDLKTPVAELRALCDVGRRWPDDAEAAARFFDDARGVALSLERTIERMLALARHEAGRETVRLSRCDLSGLLDATVAAYHASAESRDLVLDVRCPEAIAIETDRDHLARVLGSLLENAVVHSEAGTVVRCALRVDDGGAAVLQVSNRAPGLERADLAHVFERFWRKDGARTDGAHAGLGLTLARASADLLGLELSARLDDGELIMSLLVPGELVVSADVVA